MCQRRNFANMLYLANIIYMNNVTTQNTAFNSKGELMSIFQVEIKIVLKTNIFKEIGTYGNWATGCGNTYLMAVKNKVFDLDAHFTRICNYFEMLSTNLTAINNDHKIIKIF